MAKKRNPRNLNGLQLRTLALLQEMAKHSRHRLGSEDDGAIGVTNLPPAHGNHLRIGPYTALRKDASGLSNEAVWVALERKGLARSRYPITIYLTEEGLEYETGMRDRVLRSTDH